MTEIKFGFSLPIFANPGMLFFRTPNLKRINWNDLLNATLECESLGYNSIFIADHLFLGHKGEIWECISTMSALAAKTTTLEIIPIHLCNNFRHPSITAKTLSTLRDTEYEIQKVLKSMKDKSPLNDSSDHDIISQLKNISSNSKDFFDLDFLQDEFIIGTPNQVANKIDQFCKEGIEHFMIWFMDYPERTSMRIFAEKVIPLFKNKN